MIYDLSDVIRPRPAPTPAGNRRRLDRLERDECMRRTREPTRPAVDMRTRKEGSQ